MHGCPIMAGYSLFWQWHRSFQMLQPVWEHVFFDHFGWGRSITSWVWSLGHLGRLGHLGHLGHPAERVGPPDPGGPHRNAVRLGDQWEPFRASSGEFLKGLREHEVNELQVVDGSGRWSGITGVKSKALEAAGHQLQRSPEISMIAGYPPFLQDFPFTSPWCSHGFPYEGLASCNWYRCGNPPFVDYVPREIMGLHQPSHPWAQYRSPPRASRAVRLACSTLAVRRTVIEGRVHWTWATHPKTRQEFATECSHWNGLCFVPRWTQLGAFHNPFQHIGVCVGCSRVYHTILRIS